MISSLLMVGVVVPLMMVRLLRWVALFQQKEYRLDRLLVFLRTPVGREELLTVLPTPHQFTRQGMKRPVRTMKALLLVGVSMAVTSILVGALVPSDPTTVLVGLVLIYSALPLVIGISALPLVVITEGITQLYLWRAHRLYQRHKPTIIGITGSYGKTSTKLVLAHVLGGQTPVFYTRKSHNTRLSASRDFVNLYRGERVAVIEYAAYTVGEIKTLARWLPPTHAVITGFAPQHLALFGSEAAIAKAKSELIHAIPEDGTVFVNRADSRTQEILDAAVQPRKTVAFTDSSLAKETRCSVQDDGRLVVAIGKKKVATQLVGLHYQQIVMAAIAVADELDMSAADILQRLESFAPSDRFVSVSSAGRGTIIWDGFSTNPVGFQAGLDIVAAIKGKRSAVLVTSGIVDLGEQSDQIHHHLAAAARSVIDQVWYLSEEGRSPFKAVFGADQLDVAEEIQLAVDALDDKTVLLVEGRIPLWLEKKLKKLST